jgi:hypothetical protein
MANTPVCKSVFKRPGQTTVIRVLFVYKEAALPMLEHWPSLPFPLAIYVSLYFAESGAMAGADNAMHKHMLSLLSFDKNKGFTLESGQFVNKAKMRQVNLS